MSDLLGIGYSGLKAYSRALSTIGDNIANAQTPGYARRRLDMMESVSGNDSLFYRGSVNPSGVEIRGVNRSVDAWLIDDSRLSSGDSERAATKLGWLGKVEGALSDESNGIKTGLTKLFTTADQLTADPSNMTLRSQFLQAADDVASGFRTAAGELDRMGDGIEGAAASTVDQFNANLTALEQINIGLRKARPGSTNQASLLDERDRLIDKLSSQAGVSTTFENNGSVTLRASGSGDLLVGGGAVNPIAVTAAADGRLSCASAARRSQSRPARWRGCRRRPTTSPISAPGSIRWRRRSPPSSIARIRRAPTPMAIRAPPVHRHQLRHADRRRRLAPGQVAAANASGATAICWRSARCAGRTIPKRAGRAISRRKPRRPRRPRPGCRRRHPRRCRRRGTRRVSDVGLDGRSGRTAALVRRRGDDRSAAIQVARETMQTLLSSI